MIRKELKNLGIFLFFYALLLSVMWLLSSYAAQFEPEKSFMSYQFAQKSTAVQIINWWKINLVGVRAIRNLLFIDIFFIVAYVAFFSNYCYQRMQQQNILWINNWLRGSIFIFFIAGFLNLLADGITFLNFQSMHIIPIYLFSYIKFACLAFGLFALIFSYIPVKVQKF